MNIDAEQISELANLFAMVAGVFSPQNAAAIALLASALGKGNAMLASIRDQNEANAAAVWKKTTTDFSQAVDGWEQSLKKS